MFCYRRGWLLVLLGAALLVPPPGSHAATTITVTTSEDELRNDGDCALREAIRAANLDQSVDACPAGSGADTISLPAGTYTLALPNIDTEPFVGENAGLMGDLDITADLTISGAGHPTTIVDGSDLDRVFDGLNGARVTINRLRVQNGRADLGGGGIRSDGTLVLNDSLIVSNHANGAGGLSGVNLVLNRTNVSGNDGGGGGGPGAISVSGVSVMTDSVVESSSAFGGGGIANTGQLTITGSTIRNNGSIDWGGVYNSQSGVLVIERSNISGNHSGSNDDHGGGGGGLRNYGQATIRDSVISNNHLSDGGYGAGIYNTGTLTVTNTAITGNVIERADPASAASSGGGISNQGNATLVNTTISGNRVLDAIDGYVAYGGGIHTPGSLTIRSSTITGNHSDVVAGGIDGTVRAIANSIVAGNSAAASAPDCSGTLNSLGYNLIGSTADCTLAGTTTGNLLNTNPQLGPLADNGGPAPTHALLAGSPAIDAGNPAAPGTASELCPATDGRGVARPQDGTGDGTARCDIGAYEVAEPRPPQPQAVALDVRPQRCPNLLDRRSHSTVPVVIAGDANLAVAAIDPATLRLVGVAPLHSATRDVLAPFTPYLGKTEPDDCQTRNRPDGQDDLVLHFDQRQLIAALDASGASGGAPVWVVQLTGALRDGTPIVGEDVVVLPARPHR